MKVHVIAPEELTPFGLPPQRFDPVEVDPDVEPPPEEVEPDVEPPPPVVVPVEEVSVSVVVVVVF